MENLNIREKNTMLEQYSNYVYKLPDAMKLKNKLLQIINTQEKYFPYQDKKGQIQSKTLHDLYIAVECEQKTNYYYNLSPFLNAIKNKININIDQENILITAFLLTQDGFSHMKRKTGGPAFSHILAVVNKTLGLRGCTFEQVLIALLHDNIEDLEVFNLNEYRYLFGRRIIDHVLELTDKPRYYRIGFLPKSEREKIHKYIIRYINNPNNNCGKKSKEFIISLGPISKTNTYKGLDVFWDTMDPQDADKIRKHLKIDKSLDLQISQKLCQDISSHRFFDKQLTDSILPIKYCDRIHNTETLFKNPISSVSSLYETNYHFLLEDNIDSKNVAKRISNFTMKGNSKQTPYDILYQLVDQEKNKIKKRLLDIDPNFNFDEWYNKGYELYVSKVYNLMAIELNRNKRLKLWEINGQKNITIIQEHEKKLSLLYKIYAEIDQQLTKHLESTPH